jgi:DNA-binding LytR/AlgR family response regulator
MRRIAIVDDQESAVVSLETCLEKYGQEHGEVFQVQVFSDGFSFLDSYQPEYDIVFMDIDMPGMNGLKAAHRLREKDELTELIFVTNLAHYAINGYEVRALDFVVKPVQYKKFSYKLERALRMLPQKDRAVIMLKTDRGMIAVEQNDIIYVEVRGMNCFTIPRRMFTARAAAYESWLSRNFFSAINAIL